MRDECVHVLLWALGYLPALNPPEQTANVARELHIILDQGRDGFTRNARLRPRAELVETCRSYEQLLRAARDARRGGAAQAHEDIIVERHRALRWLAGQEGHPWNDLTSEA